MPAAQRLFSGRKTHRRPAQPQARQYADIDRQYREHEQAINEVGFPTERQRQRDERCGGKADARIVDADDEARRQEEQQRSVKKPRGIEIRHSQSPASRPAPTAGSGNWRLTLPSAENRARTPPRPDDQARKSFLAG